MDQGVHGSGGRCDWVVVRGPTNWCTSSRMALQQQLLCMLPQRPLLPQRLLCMLCMFDCCACLTQLRPPCVHTAGGPIYISDKPGQHDFELLRRLVLPDGSGV